MINEQLIKDVKTTIAFFENEIKEFEEMRDEAQVTLDAEGPEAGPEEHDRMEAEVAFFQEFIDESQNSLEQYQNRLAEIMPKDDSTNA